MAECKYPNIDNNCSLCFRDWLESGCSNYD
jgi:hypothetical protein